MSLFFALLFFVLLAAALLAVPGIAAQPTSFAAGSCSSYTVPAGVTTLKVDLYGAQAGKTWIGGATYSSNPARGGYLSALLAVTPGQVLWVSVGTKGGDNTAKNGGATGGYNGGGSSAASGYGGSGGGGATDIRTVSCASPSSLPSRLVVAGGAGGNSADFRGGAGGGLFGASGKGYTTATSSDSRYIYPGPGGSQTAGGNNGRGAGGTGSLGVGGDGVFVSQGDTWTGGGGGGGYFGGAGGYCDTGGGGGSSYCGAPTCTMLNNTQGVQTGDGAAFIAPSYSLDAPPPPPPPAPTSTPTFVKGTVTSIGTSASPAFNYPFGVAVDDDGTVFVADAHNNLIRRIDSASASVTSIGTAASPSWYNPEGVAVDGLGNVYVTNQGRGLVIKIDASTGSLTTIGTLASPQFAHPSGIVVDRAGYVYVVDPDPSANLVRRIDPVTGIVTTLGNSANPPFNTPYGVAVDGAGNVFVADHSNNMIRRIDRTTGAVTRIGTSASFNNPVGVAVDFAGNVFVADTHNGLVCKIDAATGLVTTVASSFSWGSPAHLVLDPFGNLIVPSASSNQIVVISGVAAAYNKSSLMAKFTHTGSRQVLLVPKFVSSIYVEMCGASGGDSLWSVSHHNIGVGGLGGCTYATLSVNPGTTLDVYVGGKGVACANISSGSVGQYSVPGGFNGGGSGYFYDNSCGGGGGATDIRSGTDLSTRLIVAGGGGGAGIYHGSGGNGGAGGGLVGGGVSSTCAAEGGTQSSGGAGSRDLDTSPAVHNGGVGGSGTLGVGGNANNGPAGGGGGGYYGGGAGSFCAGGGGSSYASFTRASGATLRQGENKGDGYVLVYFGAPPPQPLVPLSPVAGPQWSTAGFNADRTGQSLYNITAKSNPTILATYTASSPFYYSAAVARNGDVVVGSGNNAYVVPAITSSGDIVLPSGNNILYLLGLHTLQAPVDSLPANFYPTSSYPNGFVLAAGNLVGTISLPAQYTLTFDLMPTADAPSTVKNDFSDIVHLTASGEDMNGAGSRLPGVWFHMTAPTFRLIVEIVADVNELRLLSPAVAQPLNTWSTIFITVDAVNQFMSFAVTGGVIIPTMSTTFPTLTQQTWPNVKVYASDPWYPAASANIRNLAISAPSALPFNSYPSSTFATGFLLIKGNLIGVVALPTVYTLSFDVYPTGGAQASGCLNYLHLSATGTDSSGGGSRLPGVFDCQNQRLETYYTASGTGTRNERYLGTNSGESMPTNQWSSITMVIDVLLQVVSLQVTGGLNVAPITVNFPTPLQQTWPSVQVYASDPWSSAPAAKIRNLAITSQQASEVVASTAPTPTPSASPTPLPTVQPTAKPTAPTLAPTAAPTSAPSSPPSPRPTATPSLKPTGQPTVQPSGRPSRCPTSQPSSTPTNPTGIPSGRPSSQPASFPTGQPSRQPVSRPTRQPTSQPSGQPTRMPTFALQTQIKCNVSTTLAGASAASFGISAPAKAAFTKALIASIGAASDNKIKLQSTDVTILSVVDVTNVARRLDLKEQCAWHATSSAICDAGSGAGAEHQRELLVSLYPQTHLTSTSGVAVSFQLSVSTQQAGSSSPATAFNAVSSALTTAVTGGTFAANLAAFSPGVVALSFVTASTTTPQVGKPQYVILHSAKPTGTPTGQPTTIQCPAGYYHSPNSPSCTACPAGHYSPFDSHECSMCKPGTFASAPGTATCSLCDKSSYAEAAGMNQCKQCPWPYTTVFPGETECVGITINLTFAQQVIFGVLAMVIYLSCCALARKPELVLFSIFPCLDIVSDLLYLLQNTFFNTAAFIACIVFIILPNVLFLRLVKEMGALTPHVLLPVPAFMENGTLLWLGYRHGYPLYRGERLSVSFDKHDTILKALSYWIVWTVCIAMQIACLVLLIVLYAPYLAFQIPFSTLWLLFGFFLYQIKVMAVGTVWTFWFRVWRRRDNGKHDSKVVIDTGIMNESLFAEFLTETVPQLVLQSINSNACEQLNSGVAIFSITLSIFMTLNGLYRYWYYTYFLGYDMQDVPLQITIGARVISLEHATHKHGRKIDEKASQLSDSDSQIQAINKDTRFKAIIDLLNDSKFVRNDRKYLLNKVRILGLGAPETLKAIKLRRAKERRRARELSRLLKRQLVAVLSRGTAKPDGRDNDLDSDSDSDSDSDGEGVCSDIDLNFDDDNDGEEGALALAERGNAGGDAGDEEDDVWHDRNVESTMEYGDGAAAATTSSTPLTRRARLSQAARRSLTAASTWASHVARDPVATLRYNVLSVRESITSRLSGSKRGDVKTMKKQRPQPEPVSSLSWLDLLDVAVAELGCSQLPVLNDLFVHVALKSFLKHGIISERTLHAALSPYTGASGSGPEKYAHLVAALRLDGVFFQQLLGTYFEASWNRFEKLGKGADYEWPEEEDKTNEAVVAEQATDGKDTTTGTRAGTKAGPGAGSGAGKVSQGTVVDYIPPSTELALLYPMTSADEQPQKERQADKEPPSLQADAAVTAAGSSALPQRPGTSDDADRGRAASLLHGRRSTKPKDTSATSPSAEAPPHS